MQKIINGIAQLPAILKEVGCEKLFLVVDSSYPFLNIKDAIEALPVNERVMFSDFTPNPLYEQVCNGIELLKTSNCDTILAVGGGSAIDVAKCIKLAVLAKEGNAAIIPPLVSTRVACDGAKLPFIAIPTTAGTGSESTHNAVMYYEGAKQTVTNDGVLPDYAVLEPSVLKTLPLYQKKCTMMDALCQGIESWWSVNSTDASRAISRRAVQMILSNWHEYLASGGTCLSGGVAARGHVNGRGLTFGWEGWSEAEPGRKVSAPEAIMEAANLAGQAICITQTTAPHAFSYKLTSMYGLPHGHAVAICLPEIWDFMLANIEKCSDPRGAQYLQGVFEEISQLITPEGFRALLAELELTAPSAAEGDIAILAASVNPIRLANNPVPISQQEAGEIYSRILKYHI